MTYFRNFRASSALIALLFANGCVVSSLTPVTFAAQYRPMGSSSAVRVAPACATFRILTLADERKDDRAGTRTLQDKPDRSDIWIGGDVESWFRAGAERALGFANLTPSSEAVLDLSLQLSAIQIDEVAYRNSTLAGRVIIDVEVKRPGSSASRWTKRFDGTAQNYGRPGNPLNYQETLNHALDRALAQAVNDEQMRDRLCQGGKAALETF